MSVQAILPFKTNESDVVCKNGVFSSFSVFLLPVNPVLNPVLNPVIVQHRAHRESSPCDLQAREDELRIQKRFLNQMFAQVKQEFLEKRLRQQQIEQLLGHKSRPALPSTEADPMAGPSNALAPRDSIAEAGEASPGKAAGMHSPVSTAMRHVLYVSKGLTVWNWCLWQAVCSVIPVVFPVCQACLCRMFSVKYLVKHCDAIIHWSCWCACVAGDHKQARKAQLQSRAELHKARLDALNAKQRHTATAKQSTQVSASPMTQRAIADLTAAQLPASKHRVVQTPAAAVTKAPATEPAQGPSTQVKEASTVRDPSAAVAAPEPAAVKAPAPAVTGAGAQRSIAQPQAANSPPAAAAAGSRLDGSAGTKEKHPVSPSGSRQAPKRRRSRSVSPSVAGSRGGRSQAGSQRQVASSARRPTRSATLGCCLL